VEQPNWFTYVKLKGLKLSPEKFGGKEPSIKEIYDLVVSKRLYIETKTMVATKFYDGVHWLSKETWDKAKNVILESSYEGHEGATFTASKGTWLIIGEPRPIEPPIGAPKNEKYVVVETKLSRDLGLEPFIIEEKFVFKGIRGRDVKIGKVARYSYFIAAYTRDARPLKEDELKQTYLWKNYLSNTEVIKVLESTSKHLKKEIWHLERMNKDVLSKYKVVWRDVAKGFIPAFEDTGAIPSHKVHYTNVLSPQEGYYLLAILLAPQINAVVQELSSWIGGVQPRFIKYFKIPRFNPRNKVHVELSRLGRVVHERGYITEKMKETIKNLVERL